MRESVVCRLTGDEDDLVFELGQMSPQLGRGEVFHLLVVVMVRCGVLDHEAEWVDMHVGVVRWYEGTNQRRRGMLSVFRSKV